MAYSLRDRVTYHTPLPTQWVGPIAFRGPVVEGEISAPLATYERPLWPSTTRGANVSRYCGGIHVTLVDERMTRSIAFRAEDGASAVAAWEAIRERQEEIAAVVSTTSRFARLIDMNRQFAGNLLFIRLECLAGDASGHNMVTKAAEAAQNWILSEYPQLSYATISGNICTDKKTSAINGLLGRGKYMVADILVPKRNVERFLHTTAEKIVRLNYEKNYIGSTIAGSLRTANAHFANMLLGFYLATGQDAANIIEASQGMVHCEARDGDLYFSCTLPNLIIGSVGAGKDIPEIQENLDKMGCMAERGLHENARRLAGICAGVVLCGELSLLAAQTNPGELVRTHMALER
ncbi:MAG: hydroxymethylglutaryl-CoA reductase [Pseudomonadota bacterium]